MREKKLNSKCAKTQNSTCDKTKKCDKIKKNLKCDKTQQPKM